METFKYRLKLYLEFDNLPKHLEVVYKCIIDIIDKDIEKYNQKCVQYIYLKKIVDFAKNHIRKNGLENRLIQTYIRHINSFVTDNIEYSQYYELNRMKKHLFLANKVIGN